MRTPPIPDFSAARVLVAGDLMLDRYWSGRASRISPEAPVPVVQVQAMDDRPGGAANVALNLAALGAQVWLAGVVGADEAGRVLKARLRQAGIHCLMRSRGDVPTVTKLRVLSQHQQLIRLDFEGSLRPLQRDPLPGLCRRALEQAQVLVISDYAKGTVAEPQALIGLAAARGVPVLVDPKGRDFSRYRGATLLTPNRVELEEVVGPCGDDAKLVNRAEALRRELALRALLVTLGERGMLLVEKGHPALHLSTRAREVFDVTGAGDTVIGVLAAGLATGIGLADAAVLANGAAGVVVGKLGAASVTPRELRAALEGSEWHTILSEEDLVEAVAGARAQGERIVMTNGCFDILHEGHVGYLQQARRLGDRLVVAVNADASVRRLKGPTRPVNALPQRMAVLAGLGSVDWVVGFEEDTPERVICRILPDVLVKGGDYRPEQVAGGACVRKSGGEVVILPYREGYSTSDIIRAIRDE
jgi:D-beta-D-heptose 7-phosphate kinase / D-beta-D-heptose 1-phosphate adenosyltransferase